MNPKGIVDTIRPKENDATKIPSWDLDPPRECKYGHWDGMMIPLHASEVKMIKYMTSMDGQSRVSIAGFVVL